MLEAPHVFVPADYERLPDAGTVIVGNGPQSTPVAVHQMAYGNRDFAMIGPGDPLSNWKKVAADQDMSLYRSPAVHYMSNPRRPDLTPSAYYGRNYSSYLTDDGRMQLSRLDAFHDKVVESAFLGDRAKKGWVEMVDVNEDGSFEVLWTDNNENKLRYRARNLVLGPGIGTAFTPDVRGVGESSKIVHANDIRVSNHNWRGQRVLIIGAAQSGFTVADGIQRAGGEVVLTSRSVPTIHALDFHREYFRGRAWARFRLKDVDARAAEVQAAHGRGRVHPYIYKEALKHGVDLRENTHVKELKVNGDNIEAVGVDNFDWVVFATGYHLDFKDIAWLRNLSAGVNTYHGLPAVDPFSLQIDGIERAYAVGRLASIGHGPASPNFGMADENARAISRSLVRDAVFKSVQDVISASNLVEPEIMKAKAEALVQ